MQKRRAEQLHARVWSTLSEPRAVTALMVFVYTLSAYSGVLIALEERGGPYLIPAAAVVLALSSLAAVPAAWRGAWWLEAPLVLAIALSFVFMAFAEIIVSTTGLRWPHHNVSLAFITALFLGTRALRIWPSMYRPGVLPPNAVDLSRAMMEDARASRALPAHKKGN